MTAEQNELLAGAFGVEDNMRRMRQLGLST